MQLSPKEQPTQNLNGERTAVLSSISYITQSSIICLCQYLANPPPPPFPPLKHKQQKQKTCTPVSNIPLPVNTNVRNNSRQEDVNTYKQQC